MRMLTEMEMGVVAGGSVNPPANDAPWSPIIWGEGGGSQGGSEAQSQGESNACSIIQGSDARDACNMAKILCGKRTMEVWVIDGDKKKGEIGLDVVKRGGTLEGEISDSSGIVVKCHPPQS